MSYFFRKDSVALTCREVTVFSLDFPGPHFLASFIPTMSPGHLVLQSYQKTYHIWIHAISYNIDFCVCVEETPWLWLNPVTTQAWSKTATCISPVIPGPRFCHVSCFISLCITSVTQCQVPISSSSEEEVRKMDSICTESTSWNVGQSFSLTYHWPELRDT